MTSYTYQDFDDQTDRKTNLKPTIKPKNILLQSEEERNVYKIYYLQVINNVICDKKVEGTRANNGLLVNIVVT